MFHATTILCVRHNGTVAMAGDRQVTIGDIVVKQGARKLRKLYNDHVLAGFAGSAADGMALFSKFETTLQNKLFRSWIVTLSARRMRNERLRLRCVTGCVARNSHR